MNDTPQNFGSPEIFTLIIGQKRKKLYVARPVLEQIPFFSNALKGDQFKEAKEKVFEMFEDDPKAVGDLLQFVFADYVKPIERGSTDFATGEERKALKAYFKAFMAADKFMAERTANRILDRLYDYYLEYEVELDVFELLRSAGLQESKLYDYLMDTVFTEMREAARDNEQFRPGSTGKGYDENDLFDHMTKDDAIELLRRLPFPIDSEELWEKCDLHTHELTPKCSDNPSDGSVCDSE